jgi:hypothetical protein
MVAIASRGTQVKRTPLENRKNSRLQADEEARVRILAETARIPWKELQRYFARGIAIMVKPGLSLVDVAFEVTRDNDKQVKHWMETGKLQKVSDNQAMEWLEADALMWAVVVKPWVLVQPVIRNRDGDS